MAAVIERVRQEDPAAYLRVIASVISERHQDRPQA
jgi:hypothetical protein